MNFGIQFLGKHACIKLNIKLSDQQREFMRLSYPDLIICKHETKHGKTVRIEGCMLSQDWHAFKHELDKAKIRSQQAELADKLALLEAPADLDVEFDDDGTPCYVSNTPPPRPQAQPLDNLPF